MFEIIGNFRKSTQVPTRWVPAFCSNLATIRKIWTSRFSTREQEHAILSYANAEDQLAFEVGHVAPILVSVSSMDKLKIAYQTFFLDCSPYVELLKRLISSR